MYVEEFEIGAKPIEGVSTSTAGFLGQTERGPITPILITAFDEYTRMFGDFIDNSYLTDAVKGFFENGGKRCYVGRITRIGTLPDDRAKSAVSTIQLGPANSILMLAKGPGSSGNRVLYKVEEPTQKEKPPERPKNTRFKLTLMYFKSAPPTPIIDPTIPENRRNVNRREPAWLEVYDNVSVDPRSSSFYKNEVRGSQLADFFDNISTSPSAEPLDPPAPAPLTPLQGGSDGVGSIDVVDYEGKEEPITDPLTGTQIGLQRSGLEGLAEIGDISFVCAPQPDVEGLGEKLIDHCEKLKYRFAILQSKLSDATPTNLGTLGDEMRESKYAAFYFPWIKVIDPVTKSLKLIPPGGHIAGIYARTAIERGPHKAPANAIIAEARALQMLVTRGQQEILNPKGVNVITQKPGRGIRVMGARTTSRDALWKYVPVRLAFIYIERSIDEGSQWLIFEVNSERLWSRVVATITQFLTSVWRDGMLMGKTPEEGFFVKCDRTTMTQDDIDNGRLIVIIGLAVVKPAEFVIFRLAQTKSGVEIEELGGG